MSRRSQRHDAMSTTKTAKTTEPVAGPSQELNKRKPTRPLLPGQRKMIEVFRTPIQAPVSAKGKSIQAKSKRQVDLTPSLLAKRVAKLPNKTSEELGQTYQWTPEERRWKTNAIRVARAARHDQCREIRQHLPFTVDTSQREEFMAWFPESADSAHS